MSAQAESTTIAIDDDSDATIVVAPALRYDRRVEINGPDRTYIYGVDDDRAEWVASENTIDEAAVPEWVPHALQRIGLRI